MAICKCWCGRQTGLSIIDGDWYCPDHCQPSPSSAVGGEGCYYCNNGKVGACDCKPLTPPEPGTVGEWRPMSDMPKEYKDGRAIWAWCGEEDGLCMPMYTREQKWMTTAQYPTEVFPTHWQPLPLLAKVVAEKLFSD